MSVQLFYRTQKLYRTVLFGLRRRIFRHEPFIDYGWIKIPRPKNLDTQLYRYHVEGPWLRKQDLASFQRRIAPSSIVIDVGANVGFYAVMFSELVGPKGYVISFEPGRRTFSQLEEMARLNGLQNILMFNVGCGSEKTTAKLYQPSDQSGHGSILIQSGPSEEIQITPLDDYAAQVRNLQKPVSLLKIDAEGFEAEVLKGAKNFFREFMPAVCLELGGGEFLKTSEEAVTTLRDLGYVEQDSNLPPLAQVGRGENFFFIHKSTTI